MYEAFFCLQRRPFAATPDPQCWYAGGPYQSAIDELVVCAEQGQGIAVLVAPAGSGKTVLCERLMRELAARFDAVLLRHATFNTRRALLQTLLCEMQQPFDKPTDQELRLGLAPVLRRLHQLGRALVLVVDEAHLLSESLLEELRILSDQAQDGKPLVRLILVGQAGLEEKLVHPAMQALNHRIRAQVVLSTLTRQETADYLDYRVTWSGGRTDELFTPDAVDLICRAADGLPRCVNQLSDHALLLAYSEEKRPATVAHVTAALNDLKHLPLPWNPVIETALPVAESQEGSVDTAWESPAVEPEIAIAMDFDSATFSESAEDEPAVAEPPALPVYRLSSQLEVPPTTIAEPELKTFAAATPPMWQASLEPSERVSPVAAADFVEEVVIDRYTALDAGLTPPEAPPFVCAPEVVSSAPVYQQRQEEFEVPKYSTPELSWHAALERMSAKDEITARLDAVQDVLSAAQALESEFDSEPELIVNSTAIEQLATLCPTGDRTAEDALGATVLEICDDTHDAVSPSHESDTATAVFEFGGDGETPATSSAVPTPHLQEPRRYRHLFTMLRRKQQGRA